MKSIRFFSMMVLLSAGALLPWAASASTVADSSLVSFAGQASTTTKFGRSIATGDFNGDGYMDFAAGAPFTSGSTLQYVAVTYGAATTFSSTAVSTSNASILSGTATNAFGVSVATGDFNGDGYDDLVIGAALDGSSVTGRLFIVYGSSAAFTSETLSSDTNIAQITGSTGSQLGTSLGAGDINGDGYDDIVVGAVKESSNAGAIYIIPGSSSHIADTLSSFSKFTGEVAGDTLGISLAVGEVTGDSYADILVGANGNDDAASGAGAAYFIPGQASAFAASTSIGTVQEFTGETASDGAGLSVAISSVSLVGDNYGDLVIGASGNDDAANDAGAVYVVPGASTVAGSALSATGVVEITGETSGDSFGFDIPRSADFNQDGYGDLVIGIGTYGSGVGRTYLFLGTSSGLTSGSASTALAFTSSNTQALGKSVGAGDMNGDGFPELMIGGNTYSSNLGAVYLGYLYIDSDGDGVAGTTGLLGTIDTTTSSDCNDSDATVSADQTFYPDGDADGLGDPDGTTTTSCTLTLDGYALNSDDTNDSIPNNGVEIDGDEVDNDEDGDIDEVNTESENGEHPYYGSLDPATAGQNVTAVVGQSGGRIVVTYADDSKYRYTIFNTDTTDNTMVSQYKQTGYATVLDRKGKKLKLVNLYNGDSADTETLVRQSQTSADQLVADVRHDGSTEVVVTTRLKGTSRVYLLKVKTSTGKLVLQDNTSVASSKVATDKTQAKKKTIVLRSSHSKVLFTLQISKQYQFLAVE